MADDVRLRDIIDSDADVFFEHQRDPIATQIAGFTSDDPNDRGRFDAHLSKILADDTIEKKAILYDGQVVGNMMLFEMFNERQVCYWIDRAHWGSGIATRALTQFLSMIAERPLYARTAHDNIGSIRVIEKCGFVKIGEEKSYANARRAVITECVFRLD